MTTWQWGCHTCGATHRSRLSWRLARWYSIRHERRVHGFSVYDRGYDELTGEFDE